MFIEINVGENGAFRYPLTGERMLVGSDLDADVVVAGVPDRWLEIDLSDPKRPATFILDAAEGPRQRVPSRFGICRVQNGAVSAKVMSLGMRGDRSVAIKVSRPGLPPGLRRLPLYLPVLACAAVLAFFLLLPGQPEAQPEVASARLDDRPAEPATDADVRAAIQDGLHRLGVGDRVTLRSDSAGLVLQGELEPAAASTVRGYVRQAARLAGMPIVDRIRTPRALPSIALRAAGRSPQFVVLADGRRVEPGEVLAEGWTLARVEDDGLTLQRDGVSARIDLQGRQR